MRVLVIDDEPDVLLLCRVNLEFEGHEVLEAADGERGFELALEGRPHVIVLDVMLPRRDGFSVLDRLQKDPATRHIPVILLTAKAHEEDQVRGWERGADDYVAKPFSPVALTEAVNHLAAMSPLERQSRRRASLEQLGLLGRL